ncbi:hypothetical protein F0562_018927 [Nyssa sinensis]|uniref:Late embryogenesis abundant protein LEA-2 subgroup domain-containing protein n=1 Tax=Nyssa sinensis TaxID=561372 RepID=A0A5J4ZCK2_9ASTE|nr:hypothetical protein F0562_018927 [Nyssa sinensis]
MNSHVEVPIQAPSPQPRPLKRHHTARYYVHRVKESLTTRISKLVCAIFLSIIFFVGIITFILWLSLRPHRPRFHIRGFSIPGLAQQNGFENAQVNFNVTARNANLNIGVFYDAMDVTLYYQDLGIGRTSLLFPFYQEPKNTTVLAGVLSGASLTVTNQRWAQFLADRSRGTVIFRLEVSSTIRFKVSKWNSRHHKMHANCAVGVGPDGLILASYKDKRWLASVVIWLSLIPKSPIFTITNVYIPALDSQNSTLHRNNVVDNTSVICNLSISNPNKGIGIYYDNIHATSYYSDAVLGAKSILGFYQGHKKTLVFDLLINSGKEFWRGINSSENIELRVVLDTTVQYNYKIFKWKTKRHRMDFDAHMKLGPGGRILESKRQEYKPTSHNLKQNGN